MSHASTPTCKLILLGNGSVGKTSICQRFVDDGFQRVYKQTVGLDFYEKNLAIRGDKSVALQVWDIGGQSISSKMIGQYIWGSQVVFLCYDVTDQQSFTDVEDWLTLTLRPFATVSDAPALPKTPPKIYLVGNKIDLLHLRKVRAEVHDRFIEENRLDGGFFISAQSGDNVLTTFYQVAADVSGISLTAHELAFTKRVLTATVIRDTEEPAATSEYLAKLAKEDEEAAARQRAARAAAAESPDGCSCSVM